LKVVGRGWRGESTDAEWENKLTNKASEERKIGLEETVEGLGKDEGKTGSGEEERTMPCV
jgi:hypothetical protein